MLEKRWKVVSPQTFVSSAAVLGQIVVRDATLFRVKQQVIVSSDTIPSRDDLEIKRILNRTTLLIGPKTGNIDARHDMSVYVPADNPVISANEQLRSKIPEQEIERLTYEEEPIVARRVIQVDQVGIPIKTVQKPGATASSLGVSIDQIPQDLTFSTEGHLRTDSSFQGLADGVALTVTSSPRKAQASAEALSGRVGVFLMSISSGNYMGFSNQVSVSNGIPLFVNQLVYIPASKNMNIWLVRDSGLGEVRTWEVG
jgi:hypothetical protein